jgi:hypothetical protein
MWTSSGYAKRVRCILICKCLRAGKGGRCIERAGLGNPVVADRTEFRNVSGTLDEDDHQQGDWCLRRTLSLCLSTAFGTRRHSTRFGAVKMPVRHACPF